MAWAASITALSPEPQTLQSAKQEPPPSFTAMSSANYTTRYEFVKWAKGLPPQTTSWRQRPTTWHGDFPYRRNFDSANDPAIASQHL